MKWLYNPVLRHTLWFLAAELPTVVRFCVKLAAVTPPPLNRRQCFYFTYSYFSVERRRRFNINDRIKELGDLVPKLADP